MFFKSKEVILSIYKTIEIISSQARYTERQDKVLKTILRQLPRTFTNYNLNPSEISECERQP